MQEGDRWFMTGICWCRKVVAGPGLVVAGAELVVVVSSEAGKWSLVQDW